MFAHFVTSPMSSKLVAALLLIQSCAYFWNKWFVQHQVSRVFIALWYGFHRLHPMQVSVTLVKYLLNLIKYIHITTQYWERQQSHHNQSLGGALRQGSIYGSSANTEGCFYSLTRPKKKNNNSSVKSNSGSYASSEDSCVFCSNSQPLLPGANTRALGWN